MDDHGLSTARHLLQLQDELADSARKKIHREKQVAIASEYQMNSAAVSAKQIAERIQEFESSLDNSEEAFICVVGGPAGMQLFPESVMPINPDKLMFNGIDQNQHKATLIQHVSQVSIMLMARKVEKDAKPHRMGFHSSVEEK